MKKLSIHLSAEVADLINELVPTYAPREALTYEERFNRLLNEAIRKGLVALKDEQPKGREIEVRYDN